MKDRPPVSVLLVTAPSSDIAERIATTVVEERLAACGNIVAGVTSIYRWQGELQREGEVLIVFKTATARRDELAARIRELHPYDVPEILSFEAAAGLDSYVEWVLTNSNG